MPNSEFGVFVNRKSRKLFELTGEISILSSERDLWKALSGPEHLRNFNPFIASHKTKTFVSENYEDFATYGNGDMVYRKLVDFQFLRRLKYEVQFKEKKNPAHTCFEVIPQKEEGKVVFRLTLSMTGFRNVPRPIWPLLAKYKLEPSYKFYLISLLKGMKQYLETGKPVQLNQFGRHKHFS